jgi:glutathione peroxidase
MRLLIFLCGIFLCQGNTDIYSFKLHDMGGNEISFEGFRGKKMLIVNIALNSRLVNQLQGLGQLSQRYRDSLVVVVIPSNDFGNEPNESQAITEVIQPYINTHFFLAAKTSIKGPNAIPLYHWLSNMSENGVMDCEVASDFQKFLINENGELMGVFAGFVEPSDRVVVDAINIR